MFWFRIQHVFYDSFLGKSVTKLFSFFVNTSFPHRVQVLLQRLFLSVVGLSRLEHTYPTIQAFFTREGSVAVNKSLSHVLSPVEARVQCFGQVSEGQVLQAKGVSYSLTQLLPFSCFSNFSDSFYVTLYLSPADCHRMYAPVSGLLTSLHHVAGYLRPVRQPWISQCPGLYAQNERVVACFENDYFELVMVMVAAYNVGLIELSFDPYRFKSVSYGDYQARFLSPAISIDQGQHVATFLLGSTVILFCRPKQPGSSISFLRAENDKVGIGQPLFSV